MISPNMEKLIIAKQGEYAQLLNVVLQYPFCQASATPRFKIEVNQDYIVISSSFRSSSPNQIVQAVAALPQWPPTCTILSTQ